MRILHLTKFYPPHLGGIEGVTRDLVQGLRCGPGAKVDVLCAHKVRASVKDRGAAGEAIVRVASLGMLQSTSIAPTMLAWLTRMLPEVELLHVHLPDPMAALAVRWARPRCPVVLHWHSDVVRQRRTRALYAPLERWLLGRADAVVATSACYAESSPVLRPWLNKVRVIPIGVEGPDSVNAREMARVKQRVGARRLVFALGRMAYYKGYEVLIEAARHLPPQALVVVAGGGDLLPVYRRQVELAGLTERIQFWGPVSADLREALFARAEIFCQASTSRAEAYGVAVLEAMARGLPVVATRIPGSGLNWLHQEGRTGLVVPPGEPLALAAAVTTLLEDAPLRARQGSAARQRWASGLTAAAMVDQVHALYRELLGGVSAACSLESESRQ